MDKRPNIVLLLSDQQRRDALGCVNPLVQTPHLDRIAREGIRFDQAVCQAPMCVPSRYSLMLGLYPSACGVRNNGQSTVHDSQLANLPLPEMLRREGYRTLGFGKTHWYDGRCANHPQPRGFEKLWQARKADKNLYPAECITWDRDEPEAFAAWSEEQSNLPKGGESLEGYLGLRSSIPGSHHREGWLTRACLEELENYGPADERPLFLYLSLDFPHAGLYVPPEWEDAYSLDDIPERPLAPWYRQEESHRPLGHIEGFHAQWAALESEQRRRCTLRYYAATSYIDDCYGRVLAKLEEKRLLENSLIVMASDHGEMLGDRDHRFSKYCLYEGSVRVPLILAGSQVPEGLRGSVDRRPAELVDLYPTLAAAAGAPDRAELPGRSLLAAPCRAGAFAEMHGAGGRMEPSQRAPALMWRTPEWKLILHQPGSLGDAPLRPQDITGELYDLAEDPHEWRNRYGDPGCRDVRERLTLQLLMHLAHDRARWPRHTSVRGIAPLAEEAVGATCPIYGVRYWY